MMNQPAEWATAYSSSFICGVCTIARFARLNFIMVANLGFRFAPPQAIRYRRASRAKAKTWALL